MNPKQTGGYLFLFVAFLSMGLQLPQDIHTDLTFGFFGAETNLPDPDCNAIAPLQSNCKYQSQKCSDLEYIAGPQSAAAGGVNTLRFDPTGTFTVCTISPVNYSICKPKAIWSQTPGNCTQVMVSEE